MIPFLLRLLSFKSQILWEPPNPSLSALWGCCFLWSPHTHDCELEVLGGWHQSEQAAILRVLLSLRNYPSSPGCSLNCCFIYYNELLYFFFFYWQEGYSQTSHSVSLLKEDSFLSKQSLNSVPKESRMLTPMTSPASFSLRSHSKSEAVCIYARGPNISKFSMRNWKHNQNRERKKRHFLV